MHTDHLAAELRRGRKSRSNSTMHSSSVSRRPCTLVSSIASCGRVVRTCPSSRATGRRASSREIRHHLFRDRFDTARLPPLRRHCSSDMVRINALVAVQADALLDSRFCSCVFLSPTQVRGPASLAAAHARRCSAGEAGPPGAPPSRRRGRSRCGRGLGTTGRVRRGRTTRSVDPGSTAAGRAVRKKSAHDGAEQDRRLRDSP
jgi:hypothetical protein